jgi:DNA-binding CsgD family transcriptional regulator
VSDRTPNGRPKLPQRRLEGSELLRDLQRRFNHARDPLERAQYANRLAPEYVSSGLRVEIRKLFEDLGDADAGLDANLRASLLAMRAVAASMNDASPAEFADEAETIVPAISETTKAYVVHRIGVAWALWGDALQAERYLMRALSLCESLGHHWLAARTAMALYSMHYHTNGNLRDARYYAEIAAMYSGSDGDGPMRRAAMISQYDIAVVLADWEGAQALRERLKRDRCRESYTADMAMRVSDALMQGRAGDFPAMLTTLEALRKTVKDDVDVAFAEALKAIALAGTASKAEARAMARAAHGLSTARRAKDELVHVATRRKIAGILGAWTSFVVGDAYHGMRLLEVRSRWPGALGAMAMTLQAAASGNTIDMSNPAIAPVRGYLEVALRAKQALRDADARVPYGLTPTELEVLLAVAEGKSNGAIATDRNVTRNAVERRLMTAYQKLDVRTRAEAIAKLSRSMFNPPPA